MHGISRGLMKPEEIQSSVSQFHRVFTLPVIQKTLGLQTGPGKRQWPLSMSKMRRSSRSVTADGLRSWRIALKRGIEGAGDEAIENMPDKLEDRVGLVVFDAGSPDEVEVESQDRGGSRG